MTAHPGPFPSFSTLPTELRLSIWDATLEPKILAIHVKRFPIRPARTPVAKWSTDGNPVALRVCTESRRLAQERYTLRVPIYKWRWPGVARPAAVRYIHPDRDLILLKPVSHVPADDAEWMNMHAEYRMLMDIFKRAEHGTGGTVRGECAIRRLAFPRRWWEYLCRYYDIWGLIHLFFCGLREISLIEDIGIGRPVRNHTSSEPSQRNCFVGSYLPTSLRSELERLGYGIDISDQSIKVTQSEPAMSTKIQDLSPVHLRDMDCDPGISLEDDFFLEDPDVVYSSQGVSRSGSAQNADN
ncbi:hypothetical protein F4780DRAFT_761015 [Xylariomycetidae sp. FL0641]|nr:hypothetical protein F4780DRAFT_761015 [Xylariomycetidae sp. FL0641]